MSSASLAAPAIDPPPAPAPASVAHLSPVDIKTESRSDDDSAAESTTPAATPATTPTSSAALKKRGRPVDSASGGSGGSGGSEPAKKSRHNQRHRGPFNKPSLATLKRTGDSFLQDATCLDIAPRLVKCLECRQASSAAGGAKKAPPSLTNSRRSYGSGGVGAESNNIFCRFYAFRRLRFTKNGLIATAGFSDPFVEPEPADLQLWLPNRREPPRDLGQAQARFLLAQVGDQFCDLLQQETEAQQIHMGEADADREAPAVAWKRTVRGVREMCDVCDTSLFNYHWTCAKCGFVVCLDCYRSRRDGHHRVWGDERQRDRQLDEASWQFCTVTRHPHDQRLLMLSQIIAGQSLQLLGRAVHELRAAWGIAQHCGCELSAEYAEQRSPEAGGGGGDGRRARAIAAMIEAQQRAEDMEEMQRMVVLQTQPQEQQPEQKQQQPIRLQTALSSAALLVSAATDDFHSSEDEDDEATARSVVGVDASLLRGIFAAKKPAVAPQLAAIAEAAKPQPLAAFTSIMLEAIRNKRSKRQQQETRINSSSSACGGGSGAAGHRRYLPIRIMTLAESQDEYPDVPHTWLCDGRLLRLMEPGNAANFYPFQEQWKRGQPVLVSRVSEALQMSLWRPEAFSRDFGEGRNDLVNCVNGSLVPNQPMKVFWDGFDSIHLRLRDSDRQPMLLKLKDWPPGEDFAETLPARFADLMRNLPLPDYTKRSGRFNLASRLPDIFVRPDLGPKMYNAYGSALQLDHGTTNLHLDISDAVNVMVYVGVSRDEAGNELEEHVRAAYRAVDEAGCDILMRRRVREAGEVPGAIWHIYAPRDADKIRDLLNRVAIERGRRLEPNHDPIHDQSWYLDGKLRERLYREYSVEGYAIAQCRGDAVFIPAGAPHQVRNVHNCVKVAEDFVSPENVAHCFHLTQEFRQLSDTHSNHEDKLQIKNIIYHAVKDAVAVLEALLALQMGGMEGGGGEVKGEQGVVKVEEEEVRAKVEPMDEGGEDEEEEEEEGGEEEQEQEHY